VANAIEYFVLGMRKKQRKGDTYSIHRENEIVRESERERERDLVRERDRMK
jgi:hypothetical protein